MMQKKWTFIIWFLAILLLFFLMTRPRDGGIQEVPWSAFLDQVESDLVASVVIQQEMVVILDKNGEKFKARIPAGDQSYLALLREHGVGITVAAPPGDWTGIILILAIPLVGLFLLFILLRIVSGGAGGQGGIRGGPFTMGKLGSKQVKPEEIKTTFADVAGMEEAKADLMEVVDYLSSPKKYERLGGRVPKGVLLFGAPGTGKTLLARAAAGEAKVPFFKISGSEFVEMFVGVGAARVREFFDHARKAAPSIIFIDEIDAVGRSRGMGLGAGNDERESTLNQLLVEMDGFDKGQAPIVMIAATNRPDVLDQALLRPGRFDRHIVVPMPDLRAREAILRVHSKRISLAPDVELGSIARALPLGFTGADIENMVNEAALIAGRLNKEAVSQADFLAARDRVIMGPERKTSVLSSDEKKVVAYHEAGHAVAATYTPEADPVQRVTIVPHGMALGVTMMLPERDLYLKTRNRLLAEVCVCLGGRLAEELVFSEITTGASNDLERATEIAQAMVTRYGMSGLGERVYSAGGQADFLGRNLGADYSEDTARKIDDEILKIIAEQKKRVSELLREHRVQLEALANALLERETVESEELKSIFEVWTDIEV